MKEQMHIWLPELFKYKVTSLCWHSQGLLRISVGVSSSFNKWLYLMKVHPLC